MNKKDFFNNLAERWDADNHYDFYKIEMMLRLIGIKQGDTVLDVGTGTGVILPYIWQYTDTENITAIDVADKMIDVAKKKFRRTKISFICGDISEYNFNDSSFDHIVCYSVYPHFQDKYTAIKKMAKALRIGGTLNILHSSSKEHINGVHIHAHSEDINSDYLLPVAMLIPAAESLKLAPEIMIDNSEMYMFSARKHGNPD